VGRSWICNAAISFAIACAAMVAGPGAVGSAVAYADGIFDVDILDIFGDDDKKSNRRPGVGAAISGGGRPTSTVRVGVGELQPGDVVGISGGGVPAFGGGAKRASMLPPVPTAPRSRTVVIRAEQPPSAPVTPAAPVPVGVPPVVAPAPVIVPVPPPAPAVVPVPPPAVVPVPPPAPAPLAPPPSVTEPAPPETLSPQAIPFRAGYPDYLRAATVSQLLAAALPGVAGILLMTTAGGVVGYRQARAMQTLPPVGVARFLH
jgi:hypothetical protein